MDGFLLIDKPSGPTSFDVVQRIRKLSGERRVGHGGTLDPLASGCLLIALGKMTRMLQYTKLLGKTYETTIELGKTSDTFDTEGEIHVHNIKQQPTRKEVETCLLSFRGTIEQSPPPFSAVHIDGTRAYKLARKKMAFSLPPRTVSISELEIVSYNYPLLSLRVTCSSGTYIRSLAQDVGEHLQAGGVMTTLRRTGIGSLALDSAISLDHCTASNIMSHFLPIEAIQSLFTFNICPIDKTYLAPFRNGQSIPITEQIPTEMVLCMLDDELIGIGKIDATGSQLHPEKVFL